ncbi:MAG TPA: hypothetical protein VGK26_05575 [Thermoanaerobaculia bacterium]
MSHAPTRRFRLLREGCALTGEPVLTRKALIAALVFVPLLLVAALWGPSWWEKHELREAQKIAGVGSQMVPGHLTDARKKIDPGATAAAIVAALGKPSFKVGTEGKDSTHEIWTYYFADGTMIINLTDGSAVRIGTTYGRPRIPRSTRNESMGFVNEAK